MTSHTNTHISGNGDAMPDPLCRLSIAHGPHTVDLSLPRHTPVSLLLPSIVDLVQRGTIPADEARQWQLARVGDENLDIATSLHDNAIRDGELLLLTTKVIPAAVCSQDDAWHTVIDTIDTGRPPTQVMSAVGCLCAAVVGATALVWSGVVTHATAHVITASVIAAGAAVGAVAMRRVLPDPILCVALNVIAVMFAAAAAFLAVPAGPSTASSLLAAAVASSMSIMLLRITRCGAICLTALATFAALMSAAFACGVVWTLPVSTTGATLAVLSLGGLGVAAKVSMGAAGLAPAMSGPDLDRPRAVSAHHTLTGLVIGSAAAAALGAVLVASGSVYDGRPVPIVVAFAAVVGLVLVLRARTHIDMRRRSALILGGLVAIAAGAAVVTVSAPEQANWLCVLATAIGVSMLGGAVGATVNPLARRAVEVLEYLALAAVVPLACWVGGLYGLVRGLSLP